MEISGVRGASPRRRRQSSSFLRWFSFGFSVVSSSSPSCQGSGSGDSPGEIFAREEFRSGVGFTSSGVKAQKRVVAVGEALLFGFSSGRFPLSSASREGCAWRWTLGSCYGSWWLVSGSTSWVLMQSGGDFRSGGPPWCLGGSVTNADFLPMVVSAVIACRPFPFRECVRSKWTFMIASALYLKVVLIEYRFLLSGYEVSGFWALSFGGRRQQR
ncbi:hypothetical protein Bca101_078024 [Brassica carinata]